MAFREKLAWISVATMSLVYGWYFWTILPLARTGAGSAWHYAKLLQGTIITVVVLQIVLTVAAAALSPREARAPEDEREKLITLRGTRIAYFVLVTGALCVCVAGLFFDTNSLLLGNYALMAVVVANLVKDFTQIVQYRLAG
ncbi:MAG TPA: hypothetical protein VMU22_03430 [Rhizomicrobium sp.]|nr:hypothetical protein [Rhizomicrobium sp.]